MTMLVMQCKHSKTSKAFGPSDSVLFDLWLRVARFESHSIMSSRLPQMACSHLESCPFALRGGSWSANTGRESRCPLTAREFTMWNGTGMAAAWADGHSPPPGLGRSADRSATALSSSASEAAGAGEVAVCAAVGPSSAEDGPVFCNDCCTWLNSRPQWLDHYFGRIHRKTVMRLALMNGDPDDPVHVRWCDLQDAVYTS